ncbi:MAG: OmpA family protein [Buchnera aphidicola (Periphyllus acericola)]|uniref:OmpA family protein n=1 Tax=Buchnera aphidicola TaxID=9 RepID=UPI0030D5988C|nr:OmpA family protein [Buchnera aphidicola (Periphyllus acericola)]
MKNKAIFLSVLLGSSISTVQAHTKLHINSFYFGSKTSIVQPNHPKWIDLINLSDIYKNSWKKSLFGFCIGYQSNPYVSFELSYNNPINYFNNTSNFVNPSKENDNNVSHDSYLKNLKTPQSITHIQNTPIEKKKSTSPGIYPVEEEKVLRHLPPIDKKTAEKTVFKRSYNYAQEQKKVYNIYPKPNIEITTKLSLPIITNRINLYSRLGVSVNIYKNFYNDLKQNSRNFLINNAYPVVSAGIQLNLSKNLYSRIEFERKVHLFSNKHAKYHDYNSINFNFLWSFKRILPEFSLNSFPFNMLNGNILRLHQVISCSSVSFDLNNSEKNSLDKLIHSIKLNSLKNVKVFIKGNFENQKNKNEKDSFSLIRANVVSKYLQKFGIHSKQIIIKNYKNFKSLLKNFNETNKNNENFLKSNLSKDKKIDIFVEGIK